MTTVFSLFDEAAEATAHDDRETVTALLRRIRETTATDPVLRDFFLAAFASRLDPAAREHPRPADVPRFDLACATTLANDRLLPFLDGRESATVLALGIGSGRQECDLLERAPELRSLTVVGVDTGDRLAQAETAVRATAARMGIEVVFHAVPSAPERLGEDVWRLVAQAPRPLLVTASFALHRMRDDGQGDPRSGLFHRLRDLAPAAFALCEPHSDHHHVPLRARFAHAWRYYGALFAAIDSTRAAEAGKIALKQFLGREIQDVVGTRDEDRIERHEPAEAWAHRFTAAGFRLLPPSRTAGATPGVLRTRTLPDRVELSFQDTPLVAVLVGIPDWSHAR
ncbi:GRAS family protein [Lentzea sp. NPDC059081]|uniref:GRAS family protein n=1 Tax=Lentzea sp. NPDC059081 TaxID=3346719 RepID=UPI0036B3F58F